MNCCLYAVDGNETANILLQNSVKSLVAYNKIKVFCISIKTNPYIASLVDLGVHMLYVEDYPDVFKKLCSIRNYNSNNIANGSVFTFIRLFLPAISELSGYSKILYLDVDTEVYGDVNPIFDQLYNDDFFIGFNESFAPHAKRLAKILAENNICFKPVGDPYINVGAIVINYTVKNRSDMLEKLEECFHTYDKYKFDFMDQDIINTFFHVRAIDPKYISFPLGAPSLIYHFVGESKRYLINKCNIGGLP